MNTSVYWIRHKDHTDMFSQGYIGVSKNTKNRWLAHSRRKDNPHLLNAINLYGWKNLIKEVILIGEETYCYNLESKIRPTKQIGWNIAEGGEKPPSNEGKKRPEHSEFMKNKHSEVAHPMQGISGKNHPSYKGAIVATNMATGEKIFIETKAIQIQLKFNPSKVSECVNGKRKTHKGHTFKRLEA